MKRKPVKKRRKKRMLKKIKVFFKVLFIIGIIVSSVYFGNVWLKSSTIFMVKNFEFEGDMIIEEDFLYENVKSELSKNIYKTDSKKIIDGILKNPFVKAVSVSRKLPSTLKIKLKEVKPVAYVVTDKVLTLDTEGTLLPRLKPTKVHDLILVSGIPEHDLEEDKINAVLNIISLLKREDILLYNDVSEVHFSREKIILFLYDRGTPVYLLAEEAEEKLMGLKYFLKFYKDEPESKKLKYINLCFKDQVVIREET